MKVDVVIPVYKPDHKFAQLIKGLAVQSHKINKIIIMYTREDESPQSGKFDLRGFLDLHLADHSYAELLQTEVHELAKSEFDHGGTRNKGVSLSDAERVLLMTDDAVPADEFLVERLLQGFETGKGKGSLEGGRVAICCGRQIPAEDADIAERFSRGFNYPGQSRLKSKEDLKTLGIKAFFCSNVCAMYDREIFDELGGFPDKTVFNEDMIIARKALDSGYCIHYKADAEVIHSHSFTNIQQFKRNVALAKSQKAHPEIFSDVSSEAEGIRYVKAAYAYFKEHGRGYMILPFFVTCGFRFLGYRVGRLL